MPIESSFPLPPAGEREAPWAKGGIEVWGPVAQRPQYLYSYVEFRTGSQKGIEVLLPQHFLGNKYWIEGQNKKTNGCLYYFLNAIEMV